MSYELLLTNTKVLYPELSYKIVGLLYEIHNELGRKLAEKYYQRAIEEGLLLLKIPYKRELKTDLSFRGKKIGNFFLDFLIDDKIILEVKAVPFLEREYFRQVFSYLKANKLELGILANFRGMSLEYRRILNTKS